jgi:hypothetical protein
MSEEISRKDFSKIFFRIEHHRVFTILPSYFGKFEDESFIALLLCKLFAFRENKNLKLSRREKSVWSEKQ